MENELILLGNRIREVREKLGLKQEAAASAADMNVSYYSQIENGRANITHSTLLSIANSLGVKPSELLEVEHLQTPEEVKADVIRLLDQITLSNLRLISRILRFMAK